MDDSNTAPTLSAALPPKQAFNFYFYFFLFFFLVLNDCGPTNEMGLKNMHYLGTHPFCPPKEIHWWVNQLLMTHSIIYYTTQNEQKKKKFALLS